MAERLVVRGGRVVDGSGGPAVEADVAVAGGRIQEIAPKLRGDREVDASGGLVVPGFIDLHTHYDPQVLWDPWLTPSSDLGVTSVVAGNCGFSLAPCPAAMRGSLLRTLESVEDMRVETLEAGIDWSFETFPEYLEAVAARGVAINFGGFVGHTALRLWVLGEEAYERPAKAEEIETLRATLREALRAGAMGFSTDRSPFHRADGGRRVPSVVASQEELESLCAEVGESGRGVVHVGIGEDFDWLYPLQRRIGRPVTWSALLTFPEDEISRAPWAEKLESHRRGLREGARVSPQVTCRPISMEFSLEEPGPLFVIPAFGDLLGVEPAARVGIYADAGWRARAREDIDSGRHLKPRWGDFRIVQCAREEWVGCSVADLALARGLHPVEVLADIGVAEGLETRLRVTFANDDVEGVSTLLCEPGCVLGVSDAGAHVGQLCDALMPLDFLAGWVRDRGLMPLEAGIRKLSGELADLLELGDRGYLRAGQAADLVVLDWEALEPGPVHRVADLPGGGERLAPVGPRGVRDVLVNGVPIRRDGERVPLDADRLPGRVLGRG